MILSRTKDVLVLILLPVPPEGTLPLELHTPSHVFIWVSSLAMFLLFSLVETESPDVVLAGLVEMRLSLPPECWD